jgi:NAD(P)-dependent dehydrogenase (short-subunit alcohol dehydrogenase family)
MIDPAKSYRLDGRTALITGATRGIGRAMAEAFVAAGAAVCVTARKQEELDETIDALKAIGGHVTAHRGSAGDPDAIEAGVAHCITELGGIDILVNNAATNPQFGPLHEADMGQVAKVWEVNQAGPLRYAQAAWKSWMQEHRGNIINVASVGGVRAGTMIGAYNVSKAALLHMTKLFALEMAPKVRCNALAPGLVKTYFARALYENNEEAVAQRHPLRRIGAPDDIAGAALFLASDASSWMTGQMIVIDGGMSLV